MTKQEFENLTGETVTEHGYKIIETVYAFHPSICNVKGKQQIADLFKIGGYTIMLNMLPTAEKAKQIETDIRTREIEIENLRLELKALHVTEV